MNRGTFFKSLLTGLIAAPAVAKVIAETEQRPMVRYGEPRLWVQNPAWESAPYEVYFEMSPDSFRRMYPYYRGLSFGIDQHPLRLDINGDVVDRVVPA